MRKTLLTLALSLCLLGAGAQTRVRTYSPKLSASTLRLTEKRGTQGGVAADAVANLFIRLRENADKERLSRVYGVRFNVGCGDVYTAVVPVSSIVALADDNDVEEIDAGQEVRTMMDNVRTLTNVDAVHSATGLDTAYKGNGVLVGIIDAGFDFRHPNFRDSNGKSRIRAVWDQNNFMQTNSSYGYGKEYLTGEELASVSRDMELTGDTHGTHVAGIATGSYDGPYLGVAPEADIVLVSTNKTEQGIIDGLDWLLKYAEKAQKPISINLSIGTVLGFKDGTDAFTVLTDNLMKGQKGKILSIAAGNEGHRHSTLAGTLDKDNPMVKSFWILPSYNRDNLFVEGVAGSEYTLTLSLKDKDTDETYFTQTFESTKRQSYRIDDFGTLSTDNGSMSVYVSANPANGNPYFSVNMVYGMPENETWEIVLKSENGRYMINSDHGEFGSSGREGYTEGTNACTIAATATGFNSVAVGAYVSKTSYNDISGNTHEKPWTQGDIYPLSGKGPTFDGRIKPDVTAPGAAVVSSFNSYASGYYVKDADKVATVKDPTYNRTYTWGTASGTSMATPVVTGIIALWLEAEPSLTYEEVMRTIKETSMHDRFTGDVPDGIFGQGKIDALAGLKHILQMSSISHADAEKPSCSYADGILHLTTTDRIDRIEVYRTDGTKVVSQKVNANDIRLPLKSGGIYIVKVTHGSAAETMKLVI